MYWQSQGAQILYTGTLWALVNASLCISEVGTGLRHPLGVCSFYFYIIFYLKVKHSRSSSVFCHSLLRSEKLGSSLKTLVVFSYNAISVSQAETATKKKAIEFRYLVIWENWSFYTQKSDTVTQFLHSSRSNAVLRDKTPITCHFKTQLHSVEIYCFRRGGRGELKDGQIYNKKQKHTGQGVEV